MRAVQIQQAVRPARQGVEPFNLPKWHVPHHIVRWKVPASNISAAPLARDVFCPSKESQAMRRASQSGTTLLNLVGPFSQK